MAGGDEVLTKALNSDWTADDGRTFHIKASVYSAALHLNDVANKLVVADLNNGYPLLNGSRTHATVVARVDYIPDPGGQPKVGRVHVIDPWPGAAPPPEYARLLAADEMMPVASGGSLRYLASIRIT